MSIKLSRVTALCVGYNEAVLLIYTTSALYNKAPGSGGARGKGEGGRDEAIAKKLKIREQCSRQVC